MFNKIKKNMNINSNKTNKIMILLLSLFLILLNESNNNVYATDIKDVKNGQLKITSKEITYKYEDEEYYAIYNEGTTININLYGNNPLFEVSKNKKGNIEQNIKQNEKLTADIYLKNKNSELNFINNSDNEATIELGNGIKGEGFITFKNDGDKNGSFEVELESMGIEAKNINIRSNVTLLLSINIEGLIGGLKGYSNDLELNIDNNKQLIIKLQNIKNVNKPQDSYTIISNFENNLLNNLVSNEKIVLGNDQIIIGGIVYDLSLIVPEGENNMILSLEEKTEEEE